MCLTAAVAALDEALSGNMDRNGRKVSVRAGITDPCACHVDALLWIALDMLGFNHYPEWSLRAAHDFGLLRVRLGGEQKLL